MRNHDLVSDGFLTLSTRLAAICWVRACWLSRSCEAREEGAKLIPPIGTIRDVNFRVVKGINPKE